MHPFGLLQQGFVINLIVWKKFFKRILREAMMLSVLPPHKATGQTNYNATDKDPRKLEPLVRHFEYLKKLGKVRVTRVVAMLVDGMITLLIVGKIAHIPCFCKTWFPWTAPTFCIILEQEKIDHSYNVSQSSTTNLTITLVLTA